MSSYPTWVLWVYVAMNLFVFVPVVGYSVRFHSVTEGHWWDSITGRALMLLSATLGLNLFLTTLRTVWLLVSGDQMPWGLALGIVCYLLLGAALWMQWVAFEKAQK